ncbi:MAG: alpha/beta hydrolase [Anaerolineaceae bacterium]
MPELLRPTVALHYEDTLIGDKAIVFLHGWCDGSPSWASTIADLKRDYRCIAPDMRGHGKSGQPRDFSYSMEALTNDVVALCESLGVISPVVVGHSYGGMLAAIIASRFPGFARAIVVEDQALDFRPFAVQMRSLEPVIRGADSHMPFREQMLSSMMTELMPAEAKAMLESLQKTTPPGVGMALWAALFEFSTNEIEAFGDRAMCALALQPSGLIDSQEPPGYYDALRAIAPEVQISTLRCGHWVHLEKPAEFRSALRGFLGTL